MAVVKRGKQYWMDVKVRNQRYREPLDTTDWREAKKLERERIQQIEARRSSRSSVTARGSSAGRPAREPRPTMPEGRQAHRLRSRVPGLRGHRRGSAAPAPAPAPAPADDPPAPVQAWPGARVGGAPPPPLACGGPLQVQLSSEYDRRAMTKRRHAGSAPRMFQLQLVVAAPDARTRCLSRKRSLPRRHVWFRRGQGPGIVLEEVLGGRFADCCAHFSKLRLLICTQ
jgi:hypothetical protein